MELTNGTELNIQTQFHIPMDTWFLTKNSKIDIEEEDAILNK